MISIEDIEANQSLHNWDQEKIVPQETSHPLSRRRQLARLWRECTAPTAPGSTLGGAVYNEIRATLESEKKGKTWL